MLAQPDSNVTSPPQPIEEWLAEPAGEWRSVASQGTSLNEVSEEAFWDAFEQISEDDEDRKAICRRINLFRAFYALTLASGSRARQTRIVQAYYTYIRSPKLMQRVPVELNVTLDWATGPDWMEICDLAKVLLARAHASRASIDVEA